MTREVLQQYANSLKEIKELRGKISFLEDKIPKLEKRISEIEQGETVKDKVRGGYGGVQNFVVEGIPTKEYADKKIELHIKKELLKNRKDLLESLEMELLQQTNAVEEFIKYINDSFVRRIVRFRVLECMSWRDIAQKMGGMNTEDSVRMAYTRYIEKDVRYVRENRDSIKME